MPYSTDSDENNRNPFSPDKVMSLNDQFIYRFSALEETVRAGFRRVDENLNRLTGELHDRHIEINDRINRIDKEFQEVVSFKRARIDQLEKRVNELETWSKVLTARLSIAFGAVLIVWTVVAPFVRILLGIPNA